MSKQLSLFDTRTTPPKWQVDDRAAQPAGLIQNKHANSAVRIDEHLEKLSWLMDSQFRIPILNWRFGLNTFIDLIPGIGDAATTMVALYLMAAAVRYRVPKLTLVRMSFNIAIYFIGGLVPWLGDLFDTWWKPNRRNMALLRRHASSAPQAATLGDRLFVAMLAIGLLALLAASLVVIFFIMHIAWHYLAATNLF